MHLLIKFLLFYVLTCLEQNVSASGSEIINGHKAKDNTMQYMAFLVGKKHMCGGFLITEDFVMSAAHCAGLTKVILGTHNCKKADKTMMYGVQKEYIHPNYDKTKFGNDIMLLKLSRKAQLGKNIKLIKIPTRPTALRPNQKCITAGWGLTKTEGRTSDDLLVADVPIIDQKKCERVRGRPLPPNVICAGGYGTNKGFCDGDSGGPLVCNGVAVGIVAFGPKRCDYPGQPNVFTEISKFLPWINSILQK